MTKPLKLQIPQIITEFDENIIIGLNKNFGEIQIRVAQTQRRTDDLEDIVEAHATAINNLTTSLNEVITTVNDLVTRVDALEST